MGEISSDESGQDPLQANYNAKRIELQPHKIDKIHRIDAKSDTSHNFIRL